MATSAYVAQASAMGAVLCRQYNCHPADLYQNNKITELQRRLIHAGQHIPGIVITSEDDLVQQAGITASSELILAELGEDDEPRMLDLSVAQMIPVDGGKIPSITIHAWSEMVTELKAELRICSRTGSYTPDETLASFEWKIQPGRNCLQLHTDAEIKTAQYVFVLLHKNPSVKIARSAKRITGILAVFNSTNPAVSNYGRQEAPEGIGMDSFEFWCPQRRPAGQNIAMKFSTALQGFSAGNIKNGIARPVVSPNAWVADFKDRQPSIKLQWNDPKAIKTIYLSFDTDFDHPMESVLMQHPENIMPFCVRNYRIYDDKGKKIFEKKGNYQSRNKIVLDEVLVTTSLTFEVEHPSSLTPAAIFEIRCYS
jgi:hypothetical protein